MVLYVDSSALVKRYIAEAESDDVIAIMDDAVAVATSLITRTEVAAALWAALWRAVRKRRVDAKGARQARREFLEDWADFGKVPVTDTLVARGDELAWNHKLRAYDAVQLAAALACQDTIGTLGVEMMFACFDNDLTEAAREAGLQTWPE